MIRSVAELVAYGTLAVLLIAASLTSPSETLTSSAATTASATHPKATYSPLPIVPAALERGRLLFAAKGCIGCHRHADVPEARMAVGPELTTLRERAGERVGGLDATAYVRQSLRQPGAFRVSGYDAEMPQLPLSDADVDALVMFLLAPRG